MQTRLASQQGISFTEFTYQLLQAYDFYVLNQREGCTIQVGGSDQWGNIVAGIELIHKLDHHQRPSGSDKIGEGKEKEKEKEVFAVTTPLLTTPSGQKFGKSAGNAVALDERVTSVFDFYQVRYHSFVRVFSGYRGLIRIFLSSVVLVEDAGLACWAVFEDVYARAFE